METIKGNITAVFYVKIRSRQQPIDSCVYAKKLDIFFSFQREFMVETIAPGREYNLSSPWAKRFDCIRNSLGKRTREVSNADHRSTLSYEMSILSGKWCCWGGMNSSSNPQKPTFSATS